MGMMKMLLKLTPIHAVEDDDDDNVDCRPTTTYLYKNCRTNYDSLLMMPACKLVVPLLTIKL